MEKKFNKFELTNIKRTAQSVDLYVSKRNKLIAKVAKMQEEIDNLQNMIDLSNAPVKLITGGYGVEELVRKVITPTDKLDKNGNVIKQTSYEFIYDTIIPPTEEVQQQYVVDVVDEDTYKKDDEEETNY